MRDSMRHRALLHASGAGRRALAAAVLAATVAFAGPALAQSGGDSKPPTAPEVDLDEMVEIPSTTFEMGVRYQSISRYGDSWFVDQQPETTVELSSYFIDKNEVTVREFALYLSYAAGEYHYDTAQPIDRVDSGYRPAEGTADEPIREVTWRAARDYCQWAGKRLPTEAEWEYAASGPDDRTYPWGDEGPDCDRAVHFTGRSFCEEGPQPVGTRENGATPDGIHDLAGNVAEWVSDWYGPYPETDEIRVNPTGPDSGTYRVVRGGGFLDSGQFLRNPARRAVPPEGDARDVGFRCAVDADSTQPSGKLVRGELELPADDNRETTERFPAPEVERPEQLAGNYPDLGSIARLGDKIYFLARSGEAIVELNPESGEASEILSDESGLTDLAAGANRLYATNAEANEIYQIIPGMPAETVATTESEPGPIAARGTDVAWGEAGRVVAYDESSGETTVLDDTVPNAVSVALSESEVYYAADGDGNYDDMEVGAISLSGGSSTVLFDAPSLRGDWWVPSVAHDEGSDRVHFVLRRSGFPRHGFLYTTPSSDSDAEQETYTPPNPGTIAVVDGRAYWTSQRNLVSFKPGSDLTFSLPAIQTRIADLDAGSDTIVWTDAHTDRVYRISL